MTSDEILTTELNNNFRQDHGLIACDESIITCASLKELQRIAIESRSPSVLMMLADQLHLGTRGNAKSRILKSVLPEVHWTYSVSQHQLEQELERPWRSIHIPAPIVAESRQILTLPNRVSENPTFPLTDNDTDLRLMELAKSLILQSNCWLDPAGCVFARGEEVLIQAVSTSYNRCDCKTTIPLSFSEMNLNPGERMMFCDAQHAERVGISQAAQLGIPLDGTTALVTKFPCRPCILSLIGAGINRVVYDRGSYGLPDAALLLENGVEINKIRRPDQASI